MPLLSRAAALAGLAFFAAARPAAAGVQFDPATGCQFLVPDEMAKGTVSWTGDCPEHLADGSGVLRVGTGAGRPQLFAGLMHGGQPIAGLIDLGADATADYGPAWRFEGAHPIYPTTREQMVSGFRAAAAGAAAASAWYAKQGNAVSAKFYADWSRALAKAPDQGE